MRTSTGQLMEDEIRVLLTETLQLGSRGDSLTAESPLIGEIPELDSMAVVSVITAIEDRFDIEFDDDELSAEMFETLSSLSTAVAQKIAADE